jgi:hypothetical protein
VVNFSKNRQILHSAAAAGIVFGAGYIMHPLFPVKAFGVAATAPGADFIVVTMYFQQLMLLSLFGPSSACT